MNVWFSIRENKPLTLNSWSLFIIKSHGVLGLKSSQIRSMWATSLTQLAQIRKFTRSGAQISRDSIPRGLDAIVCCHTHIFDMYISVMHARCTRVCIDVFAPTKSILHTGELSTHNTIPLPHTCASNIPIMQSRTQRYPRVCNQSSFQTALCHT